MKLLLSLLLVVSSTAVDARCINRVKNLVSVEVFRCQATTIASDNREQSPHIIDSEVRGILISGKVVESKHVVAVLDSPGEARRASGKPLDLPVDGWVTLFLPGEAIKQCPILEPRVAQWFVTVDRCFDVIPFKGLGLVPSEIPVVELELHPEKWYDYGGFEDG